VLTDGKLETEIITDKDNAMLCRDRRTQLIKMFRTENLATPIARLCCFGPLSINYYAACICVSIDGYYTSSLRAVSLQCIPHADMQGQARRFQGHVPRGPPYCCSQGLILLSYFSSSFSYNGSLLAVLKHKSFHYSWLTVLKLSMFCYFCFPPVGCSGQH